MRSGTQCARHLRVQQVVFWTWCSCTTLSMYLEDPLLYPSIPQRHLCVYTSGFSKWCSGNDAAVLHWVRTGRTLYCIPLYHRDTCVSTFIVTLFIISRKYNQPRYPSVEQWIMKWWNIIHIEKMKFLEKWIELEIIEWGDSDSETHIVFSLSHINPSFFFCCCWMQCVPRFQRKDNESSHYVARKAQQGGPESLGMKLRVYNTHSFLPKKKDSFQVPRRSTEADPNGNVL